MWKHHCTWLFECFFELLICFFLNRLSILQLFNEFHFKFLHLHDLLLLLHPDDFLIVYSVVVLLLHRHQPTLSFLFDLHRSQPFLLIDDLILHLILLLNLEQLVAFLLIVLASYDLSLLGFFSLGQEDSFLHLFLLLLALFVQGIVVL